MIEMLILAAIVGYAAVAPDRGTLWLTRGLSGGTRLTVTGARAPARRGSRSRNHPKGLSARTRFIIGFRAGTERARARRAAGTDIWSRAAGITGRVVGTATGSARNARSWYREHSGPVMFDPMPEPAPDNPDNVVDLTARLKENTMQTTELATLDQLETEVTKALAAYQEVATMMDDYAKWAAALPERWQGQPWGTQGLDDAVTSLAEHLGSLKVPDISEHEANLRARIAEARSLAEQADSVKAYGNVESFRSE